MKHVVVVNGSPRKGVTHKLLDQISDLLEAQGVRTTLVDLADYQIGDCVGCELCIRKTTKCYQEDDSQAILSQLVEADGVILASPVYVMSVTGKLKSLIDKTASWIHRSPMVGKPMLSVSTTGGAGLKEVLSYLDSVGVQWGMHPTGSIGRAAMDQDPVSAKEVKNFVWHLNNPTSSYKPSLNQVIQFQVQRVLALKLSQIDREYWGEKGWDTQLYYYPSRISMVNRLIGWVFFKFLYNRIQPVSTF